MDFFISTKNRTDKEELMDDFSIGGALLRDTLDKLENINRYSFKVITKSIEHVNKDKTR